jgi:AraC-like DNA-binding protein
MMRPTPFSMMELVPHIRIAEVAPGAARGYADGWVHRKTVSETIAAQVVTGHYEIEHAGGRARIDPGELFLIGANIPMAITHRLGHYPQMEARWAHARFTLYDRIDLTSLLEMPLRISGEPAEEFRAVIGELVAIAADPDGVSLELSAVFARASRWNELGFRLLGAICAVSHVRPNGLRLLEHSERIVPILSFIDENLGRSLHVTDLADAACLSPSHFHAFFKEILGEPPMEYLRNTRLKQASRMLLTTDLPIAQIAEQTGFANPFHFSRLFKETRGLSPRAFRQTGELATL